MVDERKFLAERQCTRFTKSTKRQQNLDECRAWHQVTKSVRDVAESSNSAPCYNSCVAHTDPSPAEAVTFSRITDQPYHEQLVSNQPHKFQELIIEKECKKPSNSSGSYNEKWQEKTEADEDEASLDEEGITFDFEETISRQEGERLRILRSQKQQHNKTQNRRRSQSINLKPAWQRSDSGIKTIETFTPTYDPSSFSHVNSEINQTPIIVPNASSVSEPNEGTTTSSVSTKPHRSSNFSSSRRQIVCRHWIRGMCWKGEYCEFLHQYDMDKMPVCRMYSKTGQCQDHDRGVCIFLHEKFSDDIPVCVHYYLGFCRAGPKCRKRHQKLTVDELPKLVPDWYLQIILENANVLIPRQIDEETENILEQVEQNCRTLTTSTSVTDSNHMPSTTHRPLKYLSTTTISRGGRSLSVNYNNKTLVSGSDHDKGGISKNLSSTAATGASLVDVTVLETAKKYGIPYVTQGSGESDSSFAAQKHRIFMIKSNDLANIQKSIRLGIWASGKHNTKVLRDAYLSSSHVVLLFSANESGGFQGYGKMMTPPTPDLYPNAWGVYSSRLGDNFRVRWLKQTRIDFEKFGGLTNPLNDNQPIRKSRDCQEIPFSLAAIICTVLSCQPDNDLLEGCAEESKPRIDHKTFFDLSEKDRKQMELELRLADSLVEKTNSHYATPSLLSRKQYLRNMSHGTFMRLPGQTPNLQQQLYVTYRDIPPSSSSVPSSFLEMYDLPLLDSSTSSVKLALQQRQLKNAGSSVILKGNRETRKTEPYATSPQYEASSSPPHTYAALRALPQALRELKKIT